MELQRWADDMLLTALTEKVLEETKPNLLFRSDCLATKMWNGYAKIFGKKYLETFTPLVKKVVKEGAKFESVLTKEPPAEESEDSNPEALAKLKEKFLELVTIFLQTCIVNLSKLPKPMRGILRQVGTAVCLKFPNNIAQGVFTLFLLRFLNSAISQPETHGLYSGTISSQSRKLLISISRVLQNASFGLEFPAVDPLAFCNAFVLDQAETVQTFLNKLTDRDTSVNNSGSSLGQLSEDMIEDSKRTGHPLEASSSSEIPLTFHLTPSASLERAPLTFQLSPSPSLERAPLKESVSMSNLSQRVFHPLSAASDPLPELDDKTAYDWSVDEVCFWLHKIGAAECVDLFESKKINGTALLELDDAALNELGVQKLGFRKRILRGVLQVKFVCGPLEHKQKEERLKRRSDSVGSGSGSGSNDSMVRWTVEEVAQWALTKGGNEDVVNYFSELSLSGKTLLEEDLSGKLTQISKVGHRKKIQRLQQTFKEEVAHES